MRRWLLVLALLLGPWVGTAPAQQQKSSYVRIKIDLNDFIVVAGPALGFPMGEEGGFIPMPEIPMDPEGMGMPPPSDDPPVWVEVRLPIQDEQVILGTHVAIKHQWGHSFVHGEEIKGIIEPGLKKRLEAKRKELNKGKNPQQSKLLLAEWALQRGLMNEFAQQMSDFEKEFPEHRATKAYAVVKKQMEETGKQNDPSARSIVADVQRKGYRQVISPVGYYSLYTDLAETNSAVQERLKYLDRTYQCFYYWFALQGKALPQPSYRLVVVLDSKREEFLAKSDQYIARPLIHPGFVSQGHNVAFLSATPVDEHFKQIEKNNRSYWKEFGVSHADILKGKIPDALTTSLEGTAKLHTMGLVQKLLEIESARTTTTHEAVQQLLAASDLLPRDVLAAEWLRHGLASFFETPRLAFYESSGLASWSHLPFFKFHGDLVNIHVTQPKKLKDRASVLYRVITDDFFSQAYIALELAESPDAKENARKEARERLQLAQASAWALTYYLMTSDLDKIFTYCDEIKKLPRDAEFSPPVLAGCFGRTFQWPTNPSSDITPVPQKNLKELSNSWYNSISVTQLDIQGAEFFSLQDLAEPYKKKKKTPAKTPPNPGGFPGVPGGFPGGGS